MAAFADKLPSTVVSRAESLGPSGAAWLRSLDTLVEQLASRWQLTLGDVLSGGSEALVVAAGRANACQAVLKLGLPGSSNLEVEAQVYEKCAGNGYATLLELDIDANALLIERLGPLLADLNYSVDDQIRILCETLGQSWVALQAPQEFMTTAEKASWLQTFIETQWRDMNQPCDKQTLYRALDFCGERADAYERDHAFLIHGDAHAHNLLQTLEGDTFKFVDPDGLCGEKACDLAVPMREWSDVLLIGNVEKNARQRCAYISQLTDQDEWAIWQWGYMERISTAFVLLSLDLKTEAEKMLAVANKIKHIREI